ncbi:unnamed protein product [Adineta steineri]|uniref:Uncharacterized protein n=1 Tax=Adineta steineri TaxID=433720 RepID=A0A819P8T1_9BILA|nr:unnamed protein product [Adineta steineri]
MWSLSSAVESIELSNTVYENDNSFDSGINSNESEVRILIRDQNCSRYNKTRSSTIFDRNEEKWYIVARQVFIPFIMAGSGTVAAGLVLERVTVLINIIILCFL